MDSGNVVDADKGLYLVDDKMEFNFSSQMRFLRERADLTSREVSLRAGLSPSYFSKVENGTLQPTIASFAKLMRVLDATPNEVYYVLWGLTEMKGDGD